MTDHRIPEKARRTSIPLMTDAVTSRVRNLDLEVTPHLLVASVPEWGATSTLRLVAAQAAKGGMRVRVVTAKPREWGDLTGLDGLTVHDIGDESDAPFAVEEFAYGMTSYLEDFLFEGKKADELLVADGLGELRGLLVGDGSERRPAVDALAEVATLGRAAGFHVAASVRVGQVETIPREFVDCSAVLTLGPLGNRLRLRLLGAGPGPSGAPAGQGGGEFADYDGPRPVRVLWMGQARLWWPEG